MVWMLVAEVIVPFAIDQTYVVMPAGPEAVLPVELAQTCGGAGVMVADGVGLMGTLEVLVAEQPEASVTVRVRPTEPEAPAV